jgi:hypothetical protein
LATQIQFAKMRHLSKNKANRTTIRIDPCVASKAKKGCLAGKIWSVA